MDDYAHARARADIEAAAVQAWSSSSVFLFSSEYRGAFDFQIGQFVVARSD